MLCIYIFNVRYTISYMQSKQVDDAMVVNEPAKPVADSSKHPDNMDIVDSELIY